MKALWFDGKTLCLRELPKPELKKKNAIIRVRYAGICNTDVEILKGYMNFKGVPGHEFVGTVEKTDDPFWLGKRVVGEINIPCKKCKLCKTGLKRHCPNRKVLGISNHQGAFAEFIELPLENLHHLPSSLDDLCAVFVEPVAASYRILEQIKIEPKMKVIILGDGKLAQLIAQLIWLETKNLSVIGKHKNKLKILKAHGIKTYMLSKLKNKNLDNIKANLIIEATGNPAGIELAKKLILPQGTIVLKSTYATKTEIDLSEFVVNENTILGSRCGPFKEAIQLIEKKLIDPKPLVSAIYPIEDYKKAFEIAQRKDSLKVILKCN